MHGYCIHIYTYIYVYTHIYYILRKLYFQFLSNWMGYDHGDNFSFDFEPNGIPFGSENREQKTVTMIISHSIWKELEI